MYETEIACGMALLDERRPGWRDEIDVKTLDLGSECNCILGQLDGDYLDSVLDMGLGIGESRRYGFDISGHDRDEGAAYAALTAEWRQALTGGGDG